MLVRVGFTEMMPFEQMLGGNEGGSHTGTGGKSIFGRGHSSTKAQRRVWEACLMMIKETNVAAMELVREEVRRCYHLEPCSTC